MAQSPITMIVSIANALPATYNKAGFEALTWVAVEYVVMAPAFKFTHEIKHVGQIETGVTDPIKLMQQGEDSDMAYASRYTTGAEPTGQALVRTINNGYTACSMKLAYPASQGDVDYCTVQIHSLSDNDNDGSNERGVTVKVLPTARPLKTTPP